MSAFANLVPAACLQRQARGKRRNVWLCAALGGLFLLTAFWALGAHRAAAVERLGRERDDAQARFEALERALTGSLAKRDELAASFEQLSALRHPQPWSRRLAALTRHAPPRVVLTALTSEAKPTRAPRGPAATTDAHGQRNAIPSTVTVRGMALDHEALIRLIRAMERIEDFADVELVRASREPYRNDFAIAFELSCLVQEEARP